MPLYRNDNGTLDHTTFPGGYSIRYLTADYQVVCAKCANEWKAGEWEGEEPTDAFVDWEGEGNYCANCNEHLPSEYGDPNA